MWIFSFPQHYLLERLSFIHWRVLPFLSKIIWSYILKLISGFSILFYWSMCLLLCQYHTVLITMICSMFWNQEMWDLQICSFSRLFWIIGFPYDSVWVLEWGFPFYKKKGGHLDFDRECTESVDRFGWYFHLNNIKSSNQWIQEVLPFNYVFFKFLQQCFTVIVYKSFASIIKFIPQHFILFDATLNGIVFLMSFFDWSLLIYRNATDFYMLILKSVVLLNSVF